MLGGVGPRRGRLYAQRAASRGPAVTTTVTARAITIPARSRRRRSLAAAARTTTTTPAKIATSSDRQREDNPLTVGLITVLTETLRLAGVGRDRFEQAEEEATAPTAALRRPRRGDVASVARRVAADFSRQYFVTGRLDEGVYDPDCRFADPTVAFRGTRLWRRNLALLTPFLIDPKIDLLPYEDDDDDDDDEDEEEEEEGGGATNNNLLAPLLRALPPPLGGRRRAGKYASPSSRVVRLGAVGPGGAEVLRARWFLRTTLKLPWRPLISVRGSTDYTLDLQQSNRVVDHVESWEIGGTEALLQLFRPGPRESR
jgi:hypothetical protein